MLRTYDDDGRLIAGEVEAVTVAAQHHAGVGWSLVIKARRQFQGWHQASEGHYEMLTSEELLDVIGAELGVELDL